MPLFPADWYEKSYSPVACVAVTMLQKMTIILLKKVISNRKRESCGYETFALANCATTPRDVQLGLV